MRICAAERASAVCYVGILKGAVAKWRATSERELVVIFPASDESLVMACLNE
jgi:hypothetical protein